MADLAVPSGLAAAAAGGGGAGPAGWVRDVLPGVVRAATSAWGLRLLPPFEPGGSCSWVAPGVDAAGRPVVLKVGWPHPEAVAEAAGLRAWAGEGAVRLLDVLDVLDVQGAGGAQALLLERCAPGTSLAATLAGAREPEQDVVVGGLLRRLHAAAPPSGVPSIQAMCALWTAGLRRRGAPSGLPVDVVEAGLAAFAALASSGPSVLLCTDLHAGNVLAARRESWLVVDPKPHVGDPAYDATQHLLNCPGRLAADPVGLATRVADLAGLDAERVVRWTFARCVVEASSRPFAGPVALALASCSGS